MIYFVHMPKCGGQAFKHGLKKAYGDRLYDFHMNPMPMFASKKLQLQLRKIKRQILPYKIPDNTQIVYGHYCFNDISKYIKSFNLEDKIFLGCFFREPIEWVGSYCFYMKNKYPNQYPSSHLDAIKKANLADGFKKHLGFYKPNELDFVGLQEEYQQSLKLFEAIFKHHIPSIEKNKTVNGPTGERKIGKYRSFFAKEGILEQVEEQMYNNIQIYKEAVYSYQRLQTRYDLKKNNDTALK